MNNNLSIYLDLDNTLIQSVCGGNPSKRRTKIDLDGDIYWTMLRPQTHDFLLFCRNLAPTYILTTATKDYADKINEVFNLGFDGKEIIGRDEFSFTVAQLFGDITRVTEIDVAPNAILVDNMRPNEEMAYLKMQYLGISTHRYIQGRDYRGGQSPPTYNYEQKIITKIINQ